MPRDLWRSQTHVYLCLRFCFGPRSKPRTPLPSILIVPRKLMIPITRRNLSLYLSNLQWCLVIRISTVSEWHSILVQLADRDEVTGLYNIVTNSREVIGCVSQGPLSQTSNIRRFLLQVKSSPTVRLGACLTDSDIQPRLGLGIFRLRSVCSFSFF